MSGIGHRSPPLRQPSTASTSSAVAAATSGGAGAGASSSNSTGIGGGGGGGGAATGLGGGAGGTSSNAGFFASSSVASRALHFRRLVWDATIPIAVSVDAAELPGSITLDRAIETYYVRAPRISYLPLVLEKVRAGLLSLMLSGDAALDSIKPDSCWFSFEGIPLRWHWPVGLLFDYHTGNGAPTTHRSRSPLLTAPMRRLSTSIAAEASSHSHTPFDGESSSSYTAPAPPLPWSLSLRIGKAPPMDKLHSAPGLEHCRSSFMSQIKEADFVRYGSTKRVTNLRKTEQDALWEGVVQQDFEMYWSVASKLIPNTGASNTESLPHSLPGSVSPSRAPSISLSTTDGASVDRYASVSSQLTVRPSLMQQFNESQTSLNSAAPSESGASIAESASTAARSKAGSETVGGNGSGGASTSAAASYRSLPMRFYLAQGAPVVQEPVAPHTDEGRPVTLHAVLSALFPLLFPPMPTFSTSASSAAPRPLAYVVIQGIRVPLDAEIPWIGAMLPSADGWIAVCVHLLAEGEHL